MRDSRDDHGGQIFAWFREEYDVRGTTSGIIYVIDEDAGTVGVTQTAMVLATAVR